MKTRTLTMLVSALLLPFCISSSRGQEAEQREHTITVSIRGNPCFGMPVIAEVTYLNNADGPWTFNTLTHSRGAGIKYRVVGTAGLASGYTLGLGEARTSYGPKGGRIVSMTAPRPEPLTLGPGQSHVFTVPLERGWMGYLTPAKWAVWIQDREQKLESSRTEMTLRFTHESIAACLEIATDTKRRGSERAWHAEWLQKIMPDLELSWRTKDTSPEGLARRNAKVDKELDAFRAFLKDPKNEQAIQQAIDRINREAGLPPDSGNDDKAADTEAAPKDGK